MKHALAVTIFYLVAALPVADFENSYRVVKIIIYVFIYWFD